MRRRVNANPEVVEWLAHELRDGPREVRSIEDAAVEIATREDLVRAALVLGVVIRGRCWYLPEAEK
jgi:hypothetical protein